jgi:outer membrane protein
VGKGGRTLEGVERNLNDLTTWRTPFWIDVGYRLSPSTTVGAYAQLGFGGNGDACAGECDWTDLRLGAQAQWRLAAGSGVSPWLGVGLGYEWLSFRTLVRVPVPEPAPDDPEFIPVRTAELLGGPELLLQGGLDFEVEDSFSVGPYASATLGQYLSDGLKCDPAGLGCPVAPAIDGSGFHAWLGIGLRGTYTP